MTRKQDATKKAGGSVGCGKRGGVSRFSHALAERICLRLSEGESLNAICSGDGMPAESTVRLWVLDDRSGFAARYARARDLGLDCLADQILTIANTPCLGIKTVSKESGIETTEADMIEHRRLQVDARKWYLSKLAPKKYGEKLELSGQVTFDRAAALRRGLVRAEGK